MPSHNVLQVELKVTAIRCVARAGPLPFEIADAGEAQKSNAPWWELGLPSHFAQ